MTTPTPPLLGNFRHRKPWRAVLGAALLIGLAVSFQFSRQAGSQSHVSIATAGEIAPISVNVNGQGVNNGSTASASLEAATGTISTETGFKA